MMNWQKHKESWKRSYKNLKPIHQGKDTNYKNEYLRNQEDFCLFYFHSIFKKKSHVFLLIMVACTNVKYEFPQF